VRRGPRIHPAILCSSAERGVPTCQAVDAAALYESLFEGVLKLDPSLKVFPAHEYKGRSHSTIGQELAENPRLQKGDAAPSSR